VLLRYSRQHSQYQKHNQNHHPSRKRLVMSGISTLGAGIEKSIAQGANTTAAYADVEVGACPFTWKSNAGKTYNEALIVGRGHMADDEYQGWEGQQKLLLAGIGLRQSHKDGSGDLYRAMLGFRSNEGSQGKYSHDVRWNAFAIYGTHYRIGRNGEDETHYRWGFVVPLGKAHGHAEWDGSQLDLPEWKGSVEVGVRRFVTRRGEDVRFFGELNGIAIVPDYAGIAPRVGACIIEDTVCALAGVNIGLYPETGVAAAVGIQVNTPGVIRFNRDGTRITQVAQAAEVNGMTFQFSPGGGKFVARTRRKVRREGSRGYGSRKRNLAKNRSLISHRNDVSR
jgi:hypothetical protein